MIEEIEEILKNASSLKNNEDFNNLLKAILDYSLEPGIDIYNVRELIYQILYETE